uniref:Uncharacterized protein n=1 Tax=Solanum tuberosum TaxID=4113 RepID=M1CYZ9_SOLTU
MVTVLCKVLCDRPALDRSLPREQVNLANCEMNSQEKRQLKHIIDPDLLGKVRPDSFRKFGETTVKCLAESGVDRPSMGENRRWHGGSLVAGENGEERQSGAQVVAGGAVKGRHWKGEWDRKGGRQTLVVFGAATDVDVIV